MALVDESKITESSHLLRQKTDGTAAHPKIVALASIFPPYTLHTGAIGSIAPEPQERIDQVTEHGFSIVTAIENQEPYTHVITTGTNDYLATLEYVLVQETTL